jgi:hypothetical protein
MLPPVSFPNGPIENKLSLKIYPERNDGEDLCPKSPILGTLIASAKIASS